MLGPKILKLRQQGKSYNEIVAELGCSKGTVCYHCGKGQKEKTNNRQKRNRKKQHPFVHKLYTFRYKKHNHKTVNIKSNYKILLNQKLYSFFRNRKLNMCDSATFSIDDVIEKFGENPKCYLTGQPIDIYKPSSYQFDHIIPKSRGGENTLDNLGICTTAANKAKHNMTPDEFINLCKMVVKNCS